MNLDRTLRKHRHARRAGIVMCVLWLVGGLSVGNVLGQSYPLPRSKPHLSLKVKPGYPLPRSKPPVPPTTEQVFPLPRSKPLAAAEPEPQDGHTEKPPWERLLTRLRPRNRPDPRVARPSDADRPLTTSAAWSNAQIAAAREACRKQLEGLAISYSEAKPVGGPQGCGITAPIKVTSVGGAQRIAIRPAAIINCKLAAATVKWAQTIVQKAATTEFGEPVVKLRNAASYVCRRRNNQPDGKLSEHALGNALDISSFTLASGKTVTVLNGWRTKQARAADDDSGAQNPAPATPASRFLKQTHKGACTVFSTILGPEADAYHVNHFHFDLGRGGRYLVCR